MSLTLEQLSQSLKLPFVGNPQRLVNAACPLESPQSDGLSFCEKIQQVKLVSSQLGILITPQEPVGVGEGWNALISPHPRVSFAHALALLYPEPTRAGGVHPTAWVDPTAQVHPNAWVGPLCSLGPGTLVEDGCRLVAQVALGANCRMGARTLVQPGVSLGDGCRIGEDCVLEPGVRLLQQAQIGDKVWLGARNVLDGCRLGSGIKTDNLVYIGPGSEIGDHALLIAQSCAGPNTKMGAYSLLAAQGVVVGNVELAAQVQVAGRGVVYESVLTPGTALAGDPAVAYKLELKARALRAQALSIYQQALNK